MEPRIEASPLYNSDLTPASVEQRHWGTYNYAALWASMSVYILTYMLAAGLIQGRMNWKQAVVGLLIPPLRVLCDYSWFVGFAVSFVAYYGLLKLQTKPEAVVGEEA
jgi:cytosine/uracil/thiamine/allantoin permease